MRRTIPFMAPGEMLPGADPTDAGERMATLRSMLGQLDERDIADLKRVAEKLDRVRRPAIEHDNDTTDAGEPDDDGDPHARTRNS